MEACVEDNEVFPNPYRKSCLQRGIKNGICNTLTNEPCFIDMDKCPVGMTKEEGYTGYNTGYSYYTGGWDYRCVRLDACPAKCDTIDGQGRKCCMDKGIDTGLCNLNGPHDTCTCATSPKQTCTIQMSCPDDCGGSGYGKECCIDEEIYTGLCYLNGPLNTCKCKKRIGDNKYDDGLECTIKMHYKKWNKQPTINYFNFTTHANTRTP